jgi:hypothetical protein
MPYKKETEQQKRSAHTLLIVLLVVMGLGLLVLAGQFIGIIPSP